MMQYIIGGILLVLIVFLTGFFVRKKYYAEVDRYESWKIDIMNRPVSDELSKVKQLNMTGQTEELFERWRQGWDEIVAVQLPEVEELLFDAEEHTDKFRFNKTKATLSRIHEILTGTETKIETILKELDELIGSEEKNREEIQTLQEEYRKSKKQLLAYRHTYGSTAKPIETILDEMGKQIERFEELTEQGNYIEAREMVLGLSEKMRETAYKMEAIPKLLTECENVLPVQISELEAGYEGMKEEGYILDHVEVEEKAAALKASLVSHVTDLGELKVEGVEEGLKEMKETIESFYDILEKEVHAKHFIGQYKDATTESLIKAKEENEDIQAELRIVQQAYHLRDEALTIPKDLEHKIIQLSKRHELIMKKEEEQGAPYSNLSDELKDIRSSLDELNREQEEFNLYLQTMRKDELATREKIHELKKKVAEASRMISKSNAPGLPQGYKDLLDEVHNKIEQVNVSLTEKPLNMKFVQETLLAAEDTVDHFYKKTDELIEDVVLSERVIQYGNRYRSRYSSVHDGLRNAEEAFRQYEYRRALEEAATTLEKVEPGALKKIEKMLENK